MSEDHPRHSHHRPGNPHWIRVEEILDGALELAPEELPSYLERACGEDRALLREVTSLLKRRPALAGFLEALPRVESSTPGRSDPPPESFEGRRLGPYRIVREIGRGGMGWVFLAERADGLFHRQVALKLLRPAVESSDAARRFEAERRILARLEHPGIARLIDAGLGPGDRPYLVTEYVEGRPIHRFCRENALSAAGRLALVRQVAEAVHYAHQNLLVHRDLKPANILVTPQGHVKLLDFGIAMLLDGTDQTSTASTDGSTHRWLTPGYAAPEQLSRGPVTTATDIYQLGVLLYHLLSGRRPFEADEDSLLRLEQAVLHREPDPPSRVVGTEGPVPGHELEGDLDAIVLKALEKDPRDRYPSARALVEDLDRRRSHQPVAARTHTPGYRFGRFIRRNRVETVAAAAAALALLAGAAAAAWQAGEARQERDQAREARSQAELALAQTRDVSGVLVEILQAIDPWEGNSGDPRTARALLELGSIRVMQLEGQPMVQAGLMEALATTHRRLGQSGEAEALARQALEVRTGEVGDTHPEVAESLNVLALVLTDQGRFHEADSLHERALSIQQAHLGEAHPDVARTLTYLADRRGTPDLAQAEALHRQALEIRRAALGPSHPLTTASLRAVGRIQRIRGEPDAAEATLTEAMELTLEAVGPHHPELSHAKLNLADLLREYGRDEVRAKELNRDALRIQRASLGDDHPGLTHPLENLAEIHSARGEHATAEELLREGLGLRQRVFGDQHRAVAEGKDALASELERQGRLQEAEALRRQSLELWEATVGPRHWAVAGALGHLADLLVEQDRYEEADTLYRRAVDIRIEARGERHPAIALLYGALARMEVRRNDRSRAEALYREALDILLAERTEEDPHVRRLRQELAQLTGS